MAFTHVNSIRPGDTMTGLTEQFYAVQTKSGDPEEGKQQIERALLGSWNGRPAQPEEMGYPMVVPGSKICSYVSGQNLFIDYGLSASWTAGALASGNAASGSSLIVNA